MGVPIVVVIDRNVTQKIVGGRVKESLYDDPTTAHHNRRDVLATRETWGGVRDYLAMPKRGTS